MKDATNVSAAAHSSCTSSFSSHRDASDNENSGLPEDLLRSKDLNSLERIYFDELMRGKPNDEDNNSQEAEDVSTHSTIWK